MNEVCLTDSEGEQSDVDAPDTTPHDIIGKSTICKFYGFFKKAIGNKISLYQRYIVFSFLVNYMNTNSKQIGGPSCVVEIGIE